MDEKPGYPMLCHRLATGHGYENQLIGAISLASMRFGVLVFPGSNCDQDCYHVIRNVVRRDVDYVWHTSKDLAHYDCLILPGGFSYGDYLRAGAIARFSPVVESVAEVAGHGKLVLGICNGFQVLLEAGLLPGAMRRNDSLQFRCQETMIRIDNDATPFTLAGKRGQVLRIPIAHGEGNYYIDEAGLQRLQGEGRVVFRYCDERGEPTPEANPNGSVGNIAGICSVEGNVLGMMPHPERSSEAILGSEDGRLLFESALKYWECST